MFQFNLFLQLLLASLAFAAPVDVDTTGGHHGNAWQYGTGGGVVGFVILILDIIVIIEVLKSNRSTAGKLIWSLIVFVFPIVGLIIYYLFSHREAHRTSAGYEPVA
ncbi:Uncharacterized protein SAPIO_CDS4255 [Scedosporium apiospermum]|uniref:Cardiolipin synthase N-terminal domain-containing protein n=1 Tax=Pseudallescheria apiosperma TaxID=563466 RepID=A0A084G8J0_PSEDA|nr:Uncharacterized protein SAPIO_CDS4255 [Scedosporium apiospermum]KEZ43652.1 Uncharacterized protein SAPIO_CDS4255 [Scedosporium apiospermum]